MSFQSPWLLLGLLLLAAGVGVWVLAERRRMRYAVRYTNVDVLATVVSGRSVSRIVPPALFLLALTLLLVGLGRPHVERMVLKERATVILVIDTSRSMQAKDVSPTRLGAAQEAVRTFLDQVPGGLRVGLVVFAGEAQVATPPTRDHELVRTAVDEMDSFLIYGGTAIGDALGVAVELGRQVEDVPTGGEIASGADTGQGVRTLAQAAGDEEKGPVSILFLSDGAQTRGVLQPLEGAELAAKARIPIYTISLGTPSGVIERGQFGGFGFSTPGQGADQVIPVPPDPETMRAIAERTGGEFSEARTADALEKAYRSLSSRLGRELGESEVTFLFVALAAALLVLAGVLSLALSPRLP